MLLPRSSKALSFSSQISKGIRVGVDSTSKFEHMTEKCYKDVILDNCKTIFGNSENSETSDFGSVHFILT